MAGEKMDIPLFVRLLRCLSLSRFFVFTNLTSCYGWTCKCDSNSGSFLIIFDLILCRLGWALQLQQLWRNCCQNLPTMICLASVHGLIIWRWCFLGLHLCTMQILLTTLAPTSKNVTSLFFSQLIFSLFLCSERL